MKIPGFRFSGVIAGIKQAKKPDVALIVADRPAKATAVFTTNRLKAAPVLQGQKAIRGGKLRAIVVNSGNANAATGPKGLKNAFATADAVAKALKISENEVLVSSTGKIGIQLDVGKIRRALPAAVQALSAQNFTAAARAIMTTDAFPKWHLVRGKIGGRPFTVAGFGKGAGMIEPHMATMLAYVFTDLDLPAAAMRKIFRAAVEDTFNAISVDGDTSTNDTAVLLASGASGIPPLKPGTAPWRAFEKALREVCQYLAWMMVQDGEGATKVVEVQVRGAKTARSAKKIAYSIARSPLVKTSFFGQDPNWGRVFAAVGYSGETFDPSRVDIFYGPVPLVRRGLPTPVANEARAHKVMKNISFRVLVELNGGRGEAKVWTSDLGYGYVKINAEYR
ncbi:MAG: bifunctional glutamate N-acetyltransferase/amino-acid acetyltransferase ArgJ, partial [Deltaproteobacteria bacterium]|nr:bifunctional glutamate N-acetyltransferase/amino-acid acetyltransferase ArgJ [Deltaproteobacteria bacterium]